MSEKIYSLKSSDVVSEVIHGEAIIIDMTTGCYYSMDGTACQIWEWLMEDSISPRRIAEHFDADAGEIISELTAFLDELVEEKLLLCREAVEEASSGNDTKVTYVKPVLNKYTDMENLLLMDPIHDVGDQGWPRLSVDDE